MARPYARSTSQNNEPISSCPIKSLTSCKELICRSTPRTPQWWGLPCYTVQQSDTCLLRIKYFSKWSDDKISGIQNGRRHILSIIYKAALICILEDKTCISRYAAVQSIYKKSPLQIMNKWTVNAHIAVIASHGCFTNIQLNSSSQEPLMHDSVLEKHQHIDPKADFEIFWVQIDTDSDGLLICEKYRSKRWTNEFLSYRKAPHCVKNYFAKALHILRSGDVRHVVWFNGLALTSWE